MNKDFDFNKIYQMLLNKEYTLDQIKELDQLLSIDQKRKLILSKMLEEEVDPLKVSDDEIKNMINRLISKN